MSYRTFQSPGHLPRLSRRALLAMTAAAVLAGRPAAALTTTAAEKFVADLVDDLVKIVSTSSPGNPRADAFLALFRRTAALDAIGRFTLGVHWRSMSDAQRKAFLDAFERYASRVYTNRLGDYKGQSVEVTGSQDVGRRGILVKSVLKQPNQQDVALEWLVSDRNGSPQVVDIVAEGVSLSIAQREEFAAMLEQRSGDYDRFIADLDALG